MHFSFCNDYDSPNFGKLYRKVADSMYIFVLIWGGGGGDAAQPLYVYILQTSCMCVQDSRLPTEDAVDIRSHREENS